MPRLRNRSSGARTSCAVALVALSFAIVGTASGAHAVTIAPTQVFANDCGTASYKPTSLTQFCADAGTLVSTIRWSTWSAAGASGTGILAINSCEPYCAAGKIYKSNVVIHLSGLKKVHGKEYLLQVALTPAKGGKFNIPPSMKGIPGGTSWTSSNWRN